MRNLTAHRVRVLAEGAEVARWEPCGIVARVVEETQSTGVLTTDGGVVPIAVIRYRDQVEGLPAPSEGTGFIVSRVLAASSDRPDLFFPAPEIRDRRGRVVGCGGLARFGTPGAP